MPGLKTSMKFTGWVWKLVWKMTLFGLKYGQDWRTGRHTPTENSQEYPPPPPRALLIIKEDYKIMISPNFTRNPRRLLFPVYVFQCCHDTSHLFEASKRCQSNILRTCRLCCLRYAFPRSKFSAAKWITIAFLSGRSNQQEKRPVVGI